MSADRQGLGFQPIVFGLGGVFFFAQPPAFFFAAFAFGGIFRWPMVLKTSFARRLSSCTSCSLSGDESRSPPADRYPDKTPRGRSLLLTSSTFSMMNLRSSMGLLCSWEMKENTDPHVLVTWVKEIRRLCGQIGVARQSPSPSGQAGWGRSLPW